VKGEPVLHTDETSWWVGRCGFSLWVLTNQAGTCYRVVPARSRAEAEALLGDYQGVLVSDCLNIYDELTPRQHKCYAHHLKEIGKALQDPKVRASPYLRELRALLAGAMALRSRLRRVPWPGGRRPSGRCRRSGGQQLLLEARHVDRGEPSPGR
jgi:transposase